MRAIGPRHLDHRVRLRRWRLRAGAVGLGLLAVAVPDSWSVRGLCVGGLAVLYPLVGSLVLSRGPAQADALPVALPVAAAVEPPPPGSARLVVATSVAAPTPLSVPPVTRAPEPPVDAFMDEAAELLAARGEVLRELVEANAWRAPEPALTAPAADRPDAAVPTERGSGTPELEPVGALEPGARWVPLDDDAAASPALRTGWPFESRTAGRAGAERPGVGN